MAIDRNPNLKPSRPQELWDAENSRHVIAGWWAGKALGAKINPQSRASTHQNEARADRTRPETSSSARPRNSWISDRRGAWRVPACSRTTRSRAPPLRYQGIPDIGFSRCRPLGIGARSRGDAGAEPLRAVAHTPRSCVSTLFSPRARSATVRLRPPATSPARTPLTNLVFPHSQAAPSGAALLGDDGGQAEDLVLLRPRCGQLLLRAGSPDEAPPRAHDA